MHGPQSLKPAAAAAAAGTIRSLCRSSLLAVLVLLAVWFKPCASQSAHSPIQATVATDWRDGDPLQQCTTEQHVSLSIDPLIIPEISQRSATIVIQLNLEDIQMREAVILSAAGLHLTVHRTGEQPIAMVPGDAVVMVSVRNLAHFYLMQVSWLSRPQLVSLNI